MIKLTELLKESMMPNKKAPKLTLEEKQKMLSTISKYGTFGAGLTTKNLVEMVQQIESIITSAKSAILSEDTDWFNKIVLKEDIKNLEKHYTDFEKIATECVAYQQQMEAIYENMGHILARYFDVTPPAASGTPTVDTKNCGDIIAKEGTEIRKLN